MPPWRAHRRPRARRGPPPGPLGARPRGVLGGLLGGEAAEDTREVGLALGHQNNPVLYYII